MATINLLPWRDSYRLEKKREFISILILLCLAALVCAYIWVVFVKSTIENQNIRNDLLKKEIAALEEKVKEIESLKRRRAELETRIKIIQDLQYKRPLVVHYFDQMVRVVPEGLYFQTVARKGDQYSIKGSTESNTRVSSLMRGFDKSSFFSSPNLKNVISDGFELTVSAVDPSQADQEK